MSAIESRQQRWWTIFVIITSYDCRMQMFCNVVGKRKRKKKNWKKLLTICLIHFTRMSIWLLRWLGMETQHRTNGTARKVSQRNSARSVGQQNALLLTALKRSCYIQRIPFQRKHCQPTNQCYIVQWNILIPNGGLKGLERIRTSTLLLNTSTSAGKFHDTKSAILCF